MKGKVGSQAEGQAQEPVHRSRVVADSWSQRAKDKGQLQSSELVAGNLKCKLCLWRVLFPSTTPRFCFRIRSGFDKFCSIASYLAKVSSVVVLLFFQTCCCCCIVKVRKKQYKVYIAKHYQTGGDITGNPDPRTRCSTAKATPTNHAQAICSELKLINLGS